MKWPSSDVKQKEMIEPRRAPRARSKLFRIQSKKTDWILRTSQSIGPAPKPIRPCPKGAGIFDWAALWPNQKRIPLAIFAVFVVKMSLLFPWNAMFILLWTH